MIARPKRNSASLTAVRCRLDVARAAVHDAITGSGVGRINADSTFVSTTSTATTSPTRTWARPHAGEKRPA